MAEQTATTTSTTITPGRKGLRSIVYGLGILAGILAGGFYGTVGTMILSAYSGIKSSINLYKSSFSEDHKEKSGDYFGRGLGYLGRAVGTITVPWLQAAVSLLSGEERIRRDEFLPYDYPEIELFEKKLREKEAAAAQQESSNETRNE